MGGAILGATGAAGDQTSFRPPSRRFAAAMGSREPCRRLEAVLGALYDLGEERGYRGAAGNGEARGATAEEKIPGEREASGSGGEEAAGMGGGGRRGPRDFFGDLRAELSAAEPPSPATPPAVEVVVFHARKRKRRPSPSAAPSGGAQTKQADEEKNGSKQEFNLEKARLEVHKFGITGYKKQEQREWEQERAIMLGAKPLKKEHGNYKTYQEKTKEKKAAKDDDKGKEHMGEPLKKKKKDQKERKGKRKKLVPSIWSAGQVGKFRNGTLILQSRDIKKIKSSKVIK